MDGKILREQLVNLVKGKGAHLSFERAVKGIARENRTQHIKKGIHSLWSQVEHLRISQEDILKYIIDPDWESPKWPDEYWPKNTEEVSEEDWDASVKGFIEDNNHLVELIQNEEIDLTAVIPHTENHTYLREFLLVADHNSYHIGQLIQARKLLDDWNR